MDIWGSIHLDDRAPISYLLGPAFGCLLRGCDSALRTRGKRVGFDLAAVGFGLRRMDACLSRRSHLGRLRCGIVCHEQFLSRFALQIFATVPRVRKCPIRVDRAIAKLFSFFVRALLFAVTDTNRPSAIAWL